MSDDTVILFPTQEKTELTLEELARVAVLDDAYCMIYCLVFETEVVYNEDSGLPMFDETEDYLRFVHCYIGYRHGVAQGEQY